jgi:hypothetical protein
MLLPPISAATGAQQLEVKTLAAGIPAEAPVPVGPRRDAWNFLGIETDHRTVGPNAPCQLRHRMSHSALRHALHCGQYS